MPFLPGKGSGAGKEGHVLLVVAKIEDKCLGSCRGNVTSGKGPTPSIRCDASGTARATVSNDSFLLAIVATMKTTHATSRIKVTCDLRGLGWLGIAFPQGSIFNGDMVCE